MSPFQAATMERDKGVKIAEWLQTFLKH